MRIVHLLSQTHLTGAEVHALTLASEMRARHQDELWVISDTLNWPTEIPFIPRPLHRAKGWRRLREILFLRRFLRENRVDVIHSHSRAAVRVAWWARLGTPTALVSTLHGHQPPSLGKRLFDTYGERVIAICAELKKRTLRELNWRSERLLVLGNPVSVTPTSDDARRPWLLATRWTGPKGDRAREFLREVAIPLLRQHPEYSLVVAAPDPLTDMSLREEWLAWTQELGPRLSAPGLITNLESQTHQFSLFFGGGRVAIAGLLCGQPVIAFGEAETCGLIDEENFEQARASNFGDIRDGATNTPLDAKKILADVSRALRLGPATRTWLQEKAVACFSTTVVAQEVRAVYQSAVALKRFKRPIPILMYHQVTEHELQTRHRIFVTRERFAEHLRLFRDSGHTTLTFADLLDFKEGRRDWAEFPEKPLVLTFDDGYRNNLENAVPLLREHGMKAVIFLLCDAGMDHNSWDAGEVPASPLMTSAERQTLAASGTFEIASHGFSHRKMTEMNDAEALHELAASKAHLEKEFARPIPAFAFTYGAIDERCPELARQAGYAYALNTDRGALRLEDDPYRVFRVNVFPEDGGARLLKKISWWYRYRYRWTRGE